MKQVVEILANRAELIERSLSIVLSQIAAAIAERGQCTIALAGGSTPEPLYRAIAARDLDWDKIHVFGATSAMLTQNTPIAIKKWHALHGSIGSTSPPAISTPCPQVRPTLPPMLAPTKPNCSSSSKYPTASFPLSTSSYWESETMPIQPLYSRTQQPSKWKMP